VISPFYSTIPVHFSSPVIVDYLYSCTSRCSKWFSHFLCSNLIGQKSTTMVKWQVSNFQWIQMVGIKSKPLAS